VVTGPATVTAADLQFSSQVQGHRPGSPIAKWPNGHSLELEVHSRSEVWAIARGSVHKGRQPVPDRICYQIDARVHAGVLRVNYTIDETGPWAEGGFGRVKRLRLEVHTKARPSHPDDAWPRQANQLIALFQPWPALKPWLRAWPWSQNPPPESQRSPWRSLEPFGFAPTTASSAAQASNSVLRSDGLQL